LERGTVHFQTERPMRNVFKAHTLQPGATHRVHDVMQKQLFALYIDD
jgi:hypothetical protein